MAEDTQISAQATADDPDLPLQYIQYSPEKEEQYLPSIRQLISKDLSEPYSIYVYRYFLYQWGDLCYMVSNAPFSSSHQHSFPIPFPPLIPNKRPLN
jgi:hypothetical protein